MHLLEEVEHLYDLVYRTLNQVVEKKRVAKEAASIDAEGVDADAPVEEEEPFLTLDDTLVEVDNITLPPNRGAPDPTAHTLTRTPLDLLPAEKSDAGVDSKMNACKMAHGALLLPHSQLHAEPRLLADFLGTPLGADAAAAPPSASTRRTPPMTTTTATTRWRTTAAAGTRPTGPR